MQGKERTFTPQVEKVWNKDYQCEYYRGVIIDGEDNIVERCTSCLLYTSPSPRDS